MALWWSANASILKNIETCSNCVSCEPLRNSEFTNQLTWAANNKSQYYGVEGTDDSQNTHENQGTQRAHGIRKNCGIQWTVGYQWI